MLMLPRVLIVTAATLAAWIMVVRWQARQEDMAGCRVAFVYDGDTVALRCGVREVTARIMGLDTPETRDARCEAERAAGEAATERLRALVAGGAVGLVRQGSDRYGRWLVRMSVDGVDVAATMIGEGLAVRYAGGSRIDWCDRLEAA